MVLLATTTFAWAANPTFGVVTAPITGGTTSLTASVALPLATLPVASAPVRLIVRGDVTVPVTFDLYPSVGLLALAEAEAGTLRPYLGTGAALGWRKTGDETSFLLAWTFASGFRYPLNDHLAIRTEVSVAPFAGGIALALGADWAPWK